MMDKSQLRKRMAKIVSALSNDEKQSQSRDIFQKLINHPRYKNSKKFSIFLSTENEIDTIPIIKHALEVDKKQCFIPLVRKTGVNCGKFIKSRMIMVELTSMKEYKDLALNNYRIKEHSEPIDIERIATPCRNDPLDLVIVPGVAFSKDGRRLGHGKGYYDEFLINWSKMTREQLYCIGIAFRQQIIDDIISVAGQDYVMDEMLTA